MINDEVNYSLQYRVCIDLPHARAQRVAQARQAAVHGLHIGVVTPLLADGFSIGQRHDHACAVPLRVVLVPRGVSEQIEDVLPRAAVQRRGVVRDGLGLQVRV